jgi:hypothetical protein
MGMTSRRVIKQLAHLLDPKSISGAPVVCPEIRQVVAVILHM